MKKIKLGVVIGISVVVLILGAVFLIPSFNRIPSQYSNFQSSAGNANSNSPYYLNPPNSYLYAQDNDFNLQMAGVTPTPAEGEAHPATSPAKPANQKRIVIKNANLEISVKDAAAALSKITKLADSVSGWVVSSSSSQRIDANNVLQTYAQISVRVPAEQFTTIIDALKGMAIRVNNETVTGDDVTTKYVDLSSELGSLQSAETQLNEIMKSASKTEDVLATFNQLTTIRKQIDLIKGQLKFYDESAAYSLINVSLAPDEITKPIQIAGWSPDNTFNRAIEALVNILRLAVDLVIWLALVVLPIVVSLSLIVFAVRRFNRRNRAVEKPVSTSTES
jgi:hypothetical protein